MAELKLIIILLKTKLKQFYDYSHFVYKMTILKYMTAFSWSHNTMELFSFYHNFTALFLLCYFNVGYTQYQSHVLINYLSFIKKS